MNHYDTDLQKPAAAAERRRLRSLAPEAIRQLQLQRLNRLLADVLPRCPFYQSKYGCRSLQLDDLGQLAKLPLLEKDELVADQPGAPARFHTLPREQYVRFHQTSGTRGRPMPVLDTPDDWRWWTTVWQYVLDAAAVTPHDVAVMAFSFGPFIGFWSANDALVARGALVIPAGGMSSVARLQLIQHSGATVLCCTPTYAMHLGEVARAEGVQLTSTAVSRVIVAGEPGGSVPEVRQEIEQTWGARVVDHSGASELGPWGLGSDDGRGLHVIEAEFIAEFLDPQTLRPAEDGQLAELVLTGLGRRGGPALRYRTGDLVRPYRQHDRQCRFVYLEGGVLGRADDMLVVRGVNVFPSGVEAVVRSIEGLGEFRMLATRESRMDQLQIEVEGSDEAAGRLSKQLQIRLGLRVPVRAVAPGTLPRFEAKARRLVDQRQ